MVVSLGARTHPLTGPALFLLGVFGAFQGACAAEPSPSAAAREPVRGGRRIVLVGLDGADWTAIDPLVKAGKLPTFARLRASGRTGLLVATPPLLSPIVWTTIATGRSPEDHGILDFMVDVPSGGQAPVTSAHRRVPALWNLFSDAGRSVGVVGWWATWPAESVRGTVVTDRVAPQLAGEPRGLDARTIFPSEASSPLSAHLVRSEQVTYADLTRYVPLSRSEYDAAQVMTRGSVSRLYENRLAHLAIVAASTRTYAGMALALLGSARPDFLAVYLEGIDTLSHLFIKDNRRGQAAIEAAYRDADDLIARLAVASPQDTVIVVCSDHGFYGQDAAAALKEDPSLLTGPATAWHRPYGIIAAIESGVLSGRTESPASGSSIQAVTPLDIAPTILHLAGLPVASEMPGRVVMDLLPPDAAARPVERRPSPGAERRQKEAPSSEGDEALLARLRSLGYVGAQPTSLARQNLGEILYRQGKFAAAERQLRAVVEGQPDNLAAHLWLAKALSSQGKSRDALRVYRQALRLPGAAALALVEAVTQGLSAGLEEEARAIVDGATTKGSEIHTARAILALARSQTRLAERELGLALALDPLSFDALSRLLDLLISAGRAKDALPALKRAAERAPGSPRHLALLGEAFLAAGDGPAADTALGRALTLAPDASPVRIDLARARIAQKKWKEAEAPLGDAPPSVERSILLGVICASQGRWAEAAAHYEIALKMTSGQPTPELLNGLGWAQHQLGRRGQAALSLRQSLAQKADQPEIRRLLEQIEGSKTR